MLKQYDIVRIVTTKRIRYLSAPPGTPLIPHGNWSVIGFVDGEAVISKQSILIKIPISDIIKIGGINQEKFYQELTNAGYISADKIDMVEVLHDKCPDLSYENIKQILLSYNIPRSVKTDIEKERLIDKVMEILNG